MQELNGSAIIRHCYTWMERLGWIDNFVAAVEGRLPKDRTGREFSDSDVYKLLEAMVWEMARADDAELAGLYEAVVAKIVAAQEADGYLNTRFGRPGQEPRYSDLEWGHELYCYGHLMQAAVARLRTHGEDDLVRVARRAADHVCEVFGPGAIEAVCGHAEVETALAEFARATGEARYLEQARIFVERRGTGTLADIEFGREYYQDDVPVRDAEVLRGHAVRAMYLAAGAIDVAVELEDDELLHAVERQLDRTVARRTYLTGGIGAHHEGESFGADWELPSERAYSETCASVGSMMTYHRMMLATGESRYADLVERNLYNVVATSTAEDGRSFFYTNTLHRRAPGTVPAADEVSPRAAASMRAPWFAVSCCPPNVARTLASLGSYLAATDGNAVYLAHYAAGQVTAALPGGSLTVDVETAYPHDGRITVRVTAAPEGGADVVLRVPAWAESGAVLTVRGESSPVSVGWARAESVRVGDEVVLDLPMAPRVVTPDPRIDALRGQVAVERGPLVLCLERSADADYSAEELRVAGDPLDSDEGVILPMVPVGFDDEPWPFGARTATALGETVMVPLIPYHQWGNHGPSTMRVWMPVAGH
ncbi:glycoside hydrolase family 127 protein [Microbacterium sp. ET2]|nr:beta-L-arabinofuranosidase domain-containing protein [Microbacterium sp. ET2 (Ac-2212)]WJL97329.1 glycoside hydrolase family 127 protein [Microbacterium sp. ET2 (Ac-2212)]